MILRTLLLAAALIVTPLAAAQSPVETQPTLIRDVRLFDGEKLFEDRNIFLANGKIALVDAPRLAGPGVRVVEGKGRTLLPGLIDSHTHIYADKGLLDSLLFGVTSAIDLFSKPPETQPAVRRTLSGFNPHEADILSAGFIATAPEGHGTQYGFEIPTLSRPEEADAFVEARVAEGSQFIKIIAESRRPTLDVATIRAVVEAAHRRGIIAVAHAQLLEDTRKVVEAGVDGIVHGTSDLDLDDELVAEIVRKKIFYIPTISVHDASVEAGASLPYLERPAFAGLTPAEGIELMSADRTSEKRRMYRQYLYANIARLHLAGATILAGVDPPNRGTWYGISLHRELKGLVEAGLSPQEALMGATSRAADAWRLTGHGRIAPGMSADLLLVDGNPLEDIDATTAMIEVWKDGVSTLPLLEKQRRKLAEAAEKP